MKGQVDLVVVSGLSGSGKTTALRALEDVGTFCVDNLPAALLPPFLRLADEHSTLRQVAAAMDVREAAYENETDVVRALTDTQAAGYALEVLFLECDDDHLISRYKETRRRHPLMALGVAGDVRAAIGRERAWLAPIRKIASTVIDTTDLNVHELKRRVQARFGDPGRSGLTLHLMSFGFRHGLPSEADYAFDVRFIPNPYFVEGLRELTGLDAEVAGYVLEQPAAQVMLGHLQRLFADVLPLAEAEGKTSVTIAIGCTGGQHRSVALIEDLRARLATAGRDAYVSHRDIPR